MSVTPRKFLLCVVAFAAGLIAALLAYRVVTEPLTATNLAAAQARWTSSGIHNYDITYRMHGVRYDVQVRNGIVTEARIDGEPLHSAELGLYSMTGLFSILAMELENAEDAAPRPTMRVKFNPDLGHLVRYIRGAGGLGRGTSIDVLTLTPTTSLAVP